MRRHCDRLWEIDAVREGRLLPKDAEASARHLRVCTTCSEVAARDQRLRVLATSLQPSASPGELDLRRLRSRILRDAAGEGRRPFRVRPSFAIAAACSMVALVVFAAIRPRTSSIIPLVQGESAPAASPSAIVFAGEVFPTEGARWSQARERTDESVRLDVGTLRIQVRRQAPGERFDVLLPDGVIDVRGTTFEVTANARSTERVHVDEGVVSLRIGTNEEIILRSGATWVAGTIDEAQSAPASDSAVATSQAPARVTEARRAPTLRLKDGATVQVDDGADAYAGAIQLLESHRYSEAADAFRDFASAHAGSALAEDASFLEATALARAGRVDAAGLAAEHHLQRFPQSFHRKEAAILVARAARDRGDCARARSVLAPWVSIADAEATATLRTCAPGNP